MANAQNEMTHILCSYKTPYVIWTNAAAADALDWEAAAKQLVLPEDGTVSAAFLGSVLLDLTGRGGESPWFDFLSSVRRLVPVVQKKTYMLPDGTYTKDAHRMMGEMYVGDERFRAYHEAIAPGCAAFFRDALNLYGA